VACETLEPRAARPWSARQTGAASDGLMATRQRHLRL